MLTIVVSDSDAKFASEPGCFGNRACEANMFMYGKFTNHSVSETAVNFNTQDVAQHELCLTSIDAIFK